MPCPVRVCARVRARACVCMRVRGPCGQCHSSRDLVAYITNTPGIYYILPPSHAPPRTRTPSHARPLARAPSRPRARAPARARAPSRAPARPRAPARTPGIPHPLHKQPPHSRGQLVATWAAMFPEPFPSSWRQRWCSPHRRLRPHWSSPHWRPRPCWCSVWHALSVWLVAQRASGCSTSLSL